MKLRRNHISSGSNSLGFVIRVIVFAMIILGFLYLFYENRDKISHFFSKNDNNVPENDFFLERTYIPVSEGILLHKSFFSLSYDSTCKTAKWVAYRLTKEQLQERDDLERVIFSEDPNLKSHKTDYYDYSGSGFDRGHLVPAADMSFDGKAYKETFLLSNIVPQKRACNRGIWKELEKQTRQWVIRHKELYIISGPVYLNAENPATIAGTGICIPDAFFKIVMIYNENAQATLSFIIPNELSDKSLSNYTSTIREIENQTGINFFDLMLDDRMEEKMETGTNSDFFPLQEKLYKQRTEIWNFE
ncbi:MAG: DNA/RNA non-specific endonuclease [Saprospiraceae bacterium]|nr:DNA/RNA non-specific endonuclease [Saprospiraceae bacterium]